MKKTVNVKQVASLMFEVIHNVIKTLSAADFLKKEGEELRRMQSAPLTVAYKRFVAPKAKNVDVFVEREYNRSKGEYNNYIYVIVDNTPSLYTPSIFVNTVVSYI